ncbi:latrophilin-like protein LAT-2 [Clytia hemisphaerica]|uniref:latrophilin-like protein LAT-2 n=1 Tax=Clytia hemisphaerica TaxID=252671 RepID=UPI0034D4A847
MFEKNCTEEIQKKNNNYQIEVDTFQKVEQYISLIGTSLSITVYLLLIAIYSRFKELQNLPGLNALAMFISLLITDILAISRRPGSVTSCKYLGISMHYFYLVSQMWVTTICLDLAKTFHSSVTMVTNNKRETFVKYCKIVAILPSFFVLPAVILNEAGNINDVGYDKMCWVTHTLTRVWSVISPMVVMHLISILALAKTLLKIYLAKKKTRKTLQSDQANADLVRIALKLIIGLGLIDIIGYVQIPGKELMTVNLIFSFLFVLVRSLKGIFVCILYLCNKKVWRLFKGGTKDRNTASNISTCRSITLRRNEDNV